MVQNINIDNETPSLAPEQIKRFIEALKNVSNYDFSQYSIKSFTRRVEKILSDNNLSLDALIYKITNDTNFREQVVKDITVNTTEFFRDPEVWLDLKKILPEILLNEEEIKVWHPGCSSGQEVYSMLILLYLLGYFEDLTIFGTDLNSDMIKIAEKGVFKYREYVEYKKNFDTFFNEFPEANVSDFFEINPKKDLFKAKEFLREKPIFLKHDLVKQGNIFGTKFHIIMCRNVLIYFDHKLQDKIIRMFYDNLYKNGVLIIGKHEGILGEMSYKFKRIGSIYIKKTSPSYFL